MSKKILAQNEEIVIGSDVHDHKHQLAVVNAKGVLLEDVSLAPSDWQRFLARRLPGCRVTVVYEAGPHGYTLHDAIRALGHEAVVIAPDKHVGPKTDKRDARAIVWDFRGGRAKRVTVPSVEKRMHRQVLRTRNQLMRQRQRTQNQISSLIRFHGLRGGGDIEGRDPDGSLRFSLAQLGAAADGTREMGRQMDGVLEAIAQAPAYREAVERLTAIPGIGVLSALEIVLGVADMRAFPTSGAFASYTGLCPGEYSSGAARRQGRITRRGPGRLRGVLVQCAWIHIRYDAEARAHFEALAARGGKRKAIVASARRLAVRIWWTLRDAPQGQAA